MVPVKRKLGGDAAAGDVAAWKIDGRMRRFSVWEKSMRPSARSRPREWSRTKLAMINSSAMNAEGSLDGCERVGGWIRIVSRKQSGKIDAGNFRILCTQRPISLHRVHQVLMADSVGGK